MAAKSAKMAKVDASIEKMTTTLEELSTEVNAYAAQRSSEGSKINKIVLDHHIFDSKQGWRQAKSMSHPTLRLQLTTDASDYQRLGMPHPQTMPSFVTVVTDTGAQSCLWSLKDFYRCGFQDSDLLPVTRTMLAANREEIDIRGAIFVRLSGHDASGKEHCAPVMAYVSPDTNRFYLSREALIKLGVIHKNFPQVGAAMETSPVEDSEEKCQCQPRSLPPGRPDKLPFEPVPENIPKMKQWLLKRYAASTHNRCKHQELHGMSGPEIALHDAPMNVAHTPALIPLHWQEEVKRQLDDDVTMGILEKVPYGEPSRICHRMVVRRKPDGTLRRMVDMSSLNNFTERETHHVKTPFQQARMIPQHTWKTKTDAWNGFHSMTLREQDRYLTTFITPWGRYRYKVGPQGSTVSGDGYARRYDGIIADVERITKCVDDTAQWDTDLETHWWRVIDYLELCGRNGVELNENKFQFCQREIDFAGFCITDTDVKPLEKYLKAITDFPTPTKTTDIRSWFGLVHQVSSYNQLTEMLAPFKPFLSPRRKFEWNDKLNSVFEKSKTAIIDAIKDGVRIFDPDKPTCLRTDFSKVGLGYFLSQKHCDCVASSHGCCENGWKITLAGSRFLKPAETRYAPVEGEALSITWGLKQTRYFTQGCDNLVIVTDHRPLVKLFGDTALDEISNSRIYSLKEKTLPWKFTIEHKPGKDNKFADAASRFPTSATNNDDDIDNIASVTITEALAGIMTEDDDEDQTADSTFLAALSQTDDVRAITWELVQGEMVKVQQMQNLLSLINSTFPDDKDAMPAKLIEYWPLRNNLYALDGIVLLNDQLLIPQSLRHKVIDSHLQGSNVRVIIPPTLRKEVVQSLHSAHQGVSGMNERTRVSVYWPGITTDIKNVRNGCQSCNKIAPSQARLPPIPPMIPTTPFEAIACDYFHFIGHYYFVAADRLSGWFELQQIKIGTNKAGAQGLCKALRRLMVTFGVPVEVSSDGGPEFIGNETTAFFRRWGIRHRLSSVSFPQSNGRAELAVKTAKRLLMDNISPNGKLDNDGIVRALLTYRNTPDPGCKLSPAQILLGRQLRDTLPQVSKEIMSFNNPQIDPRWREAWEAKEVALKTRYVKTLEDLNEHSRPLSPLRHGDHVIIQNQQGQFPKKWDKSGVVVEIKDNDQYVVKVAGSGRLTLRNRRFLRKYESHFHLRSEANIPTPNPSHLPTLRLLKNTVTTPTQLGIPPSPHSCNEPVSSPRADTPVASTPTSCRSVSTPLTTSPSTVPVTPCRLTFGDFPAPHSEEMPTPPPAVPPPTESPSRSMRSVRTRTQRTVYDASSGTFKEPTAVPETI